MNKKAWIVSAVLFLVFSAVVTAQETKNYSKNGVGFDYLSNWELTEKSEKDTDEVAISNSDADARITVISLKKKFDSDDLADARKRVVEPWIASLKNMYTNIAKVDVVQVETKIDAGGKTTDAVELKFNLDGQGGRVEAYWLLLEKKLVLVYMVRPDRTAEKAAVGWDLIRQTIRAEAKTR